MTARDQVVSTRHELLTALREDAPQITVEGGLAALLNSVMVARAAMLARPIVGAAAASASAAAAAIEPLGWVALIAVAGVVVIAILLAAKDYKKVSFRGKGSAGEAELVLETGLP